MRTWLSLRFLSKWVDLASFGLKGEISIVKGIDIDGDNLVTKKGFIVKKKREF